VRGTDERSQTMNRRRAAGPKAWRLRVLLAIRAGVIADRELPNMSLRASSPSHSTFSFLFGFEEEVPACGGVRQFLGHVDAQHSQEREFAPAMGNAQFASWES
jgi:hypothetical protein